MPAPISFIPIHITDYLFTEIPPSLLKMIREEVTEIQNSVFNKEKYKPLNKSLVGAIEHEFVLKKTADAILDFLNEEIVPAYWRRNGNEKLAGTPHTYNAVEGYDPVWVNFQKKGEYNPIHVHTGDISFVIWVNVPYLIQDEDNIAAVKDTQAKMGSRFNFHTISDTGIKHHAIPVDKTFEGKMVVFPTHLNHSVTPFYTSDDFRISVAGNIVPIA